jgi:hypothetical protein
LLFVGFEEFEGALVVLAFNGYVANEHEAAGALADLRDGLGLFDQLGLDAVAPGDDFAGLSGFGAARGVDGLFLDRGFEAVVLETVFLGEGFGVASGVGGEREGLAQGVFLKPGEGFLFGGDLLVEFLGAAFVARAAVRDDASVSAAVEFDGGFVDFVAGAGAVLRGIEADRQEETGLVGPCGTLPLCRNYFPSTNYNCVTIVAISIPRKHFIL